MRISIPRIKIKKDFDRITLIHWAHLIFFTAALFSKILYGINHWGSGLFKILLLFGAYYFYFRTLKNLFYTFWTFSAIIGLYLLSLSLMAVFVYQVPVVAYLSFIALFFLLWEVYLLSSPIYNPLS